MRCPKCGYNIPEDHMYCDNCGLEINIVPDFEPEVENEINSTLSGVADELNKDERRKGEKSQQIRALFDYINEKRVVILAGIVGIALIVAAVIFFTMFSDKSSYYYLREAEKIKNSGDIEGAISCLTEGNKMLPDNPEIIFRLSDYSLEKGDYDGAIEALTMITNSARFSEDKVIAAYEGMISIYEQNGDYEALSDMLSGSDDEIITSLREKYVPQSPKMEPLSGEFVDYVGITIRLSDTSSNEKIYYTVNDGNPDSSSIYYENDIVIDTPGVYDVKAVSVNEYGIPSQIVENKYTVIEGAPSAPEVMEPSGEYNQNTMIVVVGEAGSTIFYTTDGTDPTEESKQYISPIAMPVGTTHYKFVAIDEDGDMSEIVERDYHLVFTRLVSKEQAVSLVVSTLVRLNYLLDNSGKVIGQEGHNEYIYNNEVEIEGAGEYYVIVENHVYDDGLTNPTGLLYAVNTHDGSVNRLGYDSSGKYTLLKISNR